MTTDVKTEMPTQEEFDRAFSELMGLPAQIAELRRRLKELETRQEHAQEIVNKAQGK